MYGGLRMTKEQRKSVYDKLVKANELWRDDGALVKEFGEPKKKVEPEKPEAKKKNAK